MFDPVEPSYDLVVLCCESERLPEKAYSTEKSISMGNSDRLIQRNILNLPFWYRQRIIPCASICLTSRYTSSARDLAVTPCETLEKLANFRCERLVVARICQAHLTFLLLHSPQLSTALPLCFFFGFESSLPPGAP